MHTWRCPMVRLKLICKPTQDSLAQLEWVYRRASRFLPSGEAVETTIPTHASPPVAPLLQAAKEVWAIRHPACGLPERAPV